MSFDLSTLNFKVETNELLQAIALVDKLSTSVSKLKTPLKEMGNVATTSADSTEKGAERSTNAVKKQTQQTTEMSAAVKLFYKEQDRLAKESQKVQEQAAKAAVSMNSGAVKLYEKYLDDQVKAQTRATNARIANTEREITVLEKLRLQAKYVSQGSSRGEASTLARAETSGQGADVGAIRSEQEKIRKFIGGDPFDRSSSGLKSLQQELGQAREGYRQLIKYTEEYEKLKNAGKGEESSLVGLNKRESENLYRDKQKSFEIYKQQRAEIKATTAAEIQAGTTTVEEGARRLKEQKEALKQSLKDNETHYKQLATLKRPVSDIQTVDSQKKRDKLNYLARATSVQLGDIGVSLAGGQNPLTVFLQQGDQMRAIFGDIGREGHNMTKVLNSAFSQIVVGFRDVGLKLGEFVLIAFKNTAIAAAELAMSMSGVNFVGNLLASGASKIMTAFGASTESVKKFNEMFKEYSRMLATPVVATGIVVVIAALVALAIAYKNMLAVSHELSNALILNGAALAVTKKEALDMASAMASGSATSIEVAKIITEVAKAGNIGKDALYGVTTAAIDMNRYLGLSTKDVVDAYSKLADDPVKALTEIGLATGRVSASTIERVNGLIEEGKKTEAVTLANQELTRAYAEMAQKAKDEMTPIGKLWDEMKQSMNLLTESVYSFAKTESVVTGLTIAWRGLASTIAAVAFLAKSAWTIAADAPAQKMINQEKQWEDLKKTATSIWNPAQAEKDRRVEQAAAALEKEKMYVDVVKDGIATRREATAADVAAFKVERDAIAGRVNSEKLKKQYGANSKLAADERAKQQRAAIEMNNAAAASQLKGANANAAEIEKQRADTEYAIRKHFKDPKEKSNAAGIKDGINERLQEIENSRKAEERALKSQVESLDNERDRGLVNEEDYINKKADLEIASLRKTKMFFEQEKEEAAKKVNSLKEVKALEGKIQKAAWDEEDRNIKKRYELSRLATAQARETANNAADIIEASDKKALALEGQVKDEKFAISLIGLSAKAIAEREAAKLRELAVDARLIAAIQIESNPANAEAILRQAAAYDELATMKIKAQQATQLAQVNQNLFGEPRSQLATPVIGKATEAISQDSGKAKEVIETLKAERKEIELRILATDSVREADTKRFEELTAQIDKIQARLKLNLTIAGIEDIGTQLNGLLGGFSTLAQNNVDNITASINRMGDSYKGQFKGMLKDAQDQAAMYGRVQKATQSLGVGIKSVLEAEKKGAEGSKERFSAQIEGYGNVAGAAAEYFEKGSTGYELLKGAEMAFRGIQLAMSIAAMIQDDAEAGNSIVNSNATGLAAMWAGVAKAFQQMGVFGFIGAAAILAFLGSQFGGGGGGSGSFGTMGAGQGIDSSGNRISTAGKYNSGDDTTSGSTTSNGDQTTADNSAEIQINKAANAVQNLKIEAMKLTAGAEELEKSLMRAKIAAGGAGLATYELSVQGMSEAEVASYNYTQALKGQISVQMDIANGTELTSENMKKLADEAQQLAIDLATASGDIAGAQRLQTLKDTAGMTSDEVAVYNHNQSVKAQIEAINNAASAARDAAQAEQDLAQSRYDIAARLNILLGRTTQVEVDRAKELASTTDEVSLTMLKLVYQLEDMTLALDNSFAKLERSVAEEKKLVEVRLKSATDLQTILKSAKDTSTPALSRKAAQAQLALFLAIAKSSGMLPAADALKPALTAIAKPSEELFSSFEDYQRDYLKTAIDIAEVSKLADEQVTIEQATLDNLDLQLETARKQLDALKGIDTSVTSVALAVADFNVAMTKLLTAQANSPTYTYAPPVNTSSTSGSGSGSGSYTQDPSNPAYMLPTYEDIAGQDNKAIVMAYREYYNRNPDPSGYAGYVASHLTGDSLMKAILGGAAANPNSEDFKTAVSKGYNPNNPDAKFYKISSNNTSTSSTGAEGSFAQGINYVPDDMVAQIHKGERILPAADNSELFARLQDPQTNAFILQQALVRVTEELKGLRIEAQQTVLNTSKTAQGIRNITSEDGTSIVVVNQ